MATTLDVTETYGLSDDKVRDFKEAFDYFAEQEGLYEELFTKNLAQHLIDMGYEASTAELAQFRLACDATATGKYTFDGFLKVISKILKTGDMEDVLKQAFRIFDKEGITRILHSYINQSFQIELSPLLRHADKTCKMHAGMQPNLL